MKRLGRKVMYESNWIDFYLDRVEMNDKSIIEDYHVINYHREGVTVIVENENNEILFVEAHRYLLGTTEWEIPAGGTEKGACGAARTARGPTWPQSGYGNRAPAAFWAFNRYHAPMQTLSDFACRALAHGALAPVADERSHARVPRARGFAPSSARIAPIRRARLAAALR